MASYPFGTETITLKRDGTFVQRVTIENHSLVLGNSIRKKAG